MIEPSHAASLVVGDFRDAVINDVGTDRKNEPTRAGLGVTMLSNTEVSCRSLSLRSLESVPEMDVPKMCVSFSELRHDEEQPAVKEVEEVTHTDYDDEEEVGDHDENGNGKDNSNKQGSEKAIGPYTQREYMFISCVGVVLTFNSGFVNGTCVSGLVAPSGRKLSSTGVTGTITKSSLELADGDIQEYGFLVCMLLCFLLGSYIAGFLTPNPTPLRIEPTFGPSFLIGAALLIAASLVAALQLNEDFIFYLVAVASGLQNGLSSIYSGNLIRSTGVTGTTTDIGILIGQQLRGNREKTWKLCILLCLFTAFWSGALISFYATQHVTTLSLLFNAGLFLLIGGSLFAFLGYELGISLWAAMCGTWQWDKAMEKLQVAFAEELGGTGGGPMSESQLDAIFDRVDADSSGEIDQDELFIALQTAGIKVTKQECIKMLELADLDGDGTISRKEWRKLAQNCQKRKSSRNLVKNVSQRLMKSLSFRRNDSQRTKAET